MQISGTPTNDDNFKLFEQKVQLMKNHRVRVRKVYVRNLTFLNI